MAASHQRRPSAQDFGLRRKQLDNHRLRSAGQIADHVLQQLREFDIQNRLGLFDLGANVGDYLVARLASDTVRLK